MDAERTSIERSLAATGVLLDWGCTEETPRWLTYRARINVPVPATGEFPPLAHVEIKIARPYPFGNIFVTALDEAYQGHPHQDGSHLLCLPPDLLDRIDAEKIADVARATHKWLIGAANRTLVATGEHYELPGFFPTADPLPHVLFQEDAESFGSAGQLPRLGKAIMSGRLDRGPVYLLAWCDTQEKVLRQNDWKRPSEPTQRAVWVRLDREPITRDRRVVRTWGEAVECFKASGVDTSALFRLISGWRPTSLIVGFPIPSEVDGPGIEYHWQPLRIPEIKVKVRPGWQFPSDWPLAWWSAENIALRRAYIRGALPDLLCDEKVLIVGAGAIGSSVAMLLARGGVRDLVASDAQTLEAGNLARGTYGVCHVGFNKALSLAADLEFTLPFVEVQSVLHMVPPLPKSAQSCGLWIDCTATNRTLSYLDSEAAKENVRVVALSTSREAKHLLIALSGEHGTASELRERLLLSLDEGTRDEFSTGDLRPGAGCWSATFPAPNHRIMLWSAWAIEQLVQRLRTLAAWAGLFTLSDGGIRLEREER